MPSHHLTTRLYLAPMEGLGAIEFRKMLAAIGGFDECCTEFIRIPTNPHIASLIKEFNPDATSPIPQAAQLMGVNPGHLAEAAFLLAEKGAHRVELNCGCPSNTVTGKGAGSSLLDTPDLLFEILYQMCKKCPVPVTAKLRIGVDDDLNFIKNIHLVQEAGCKMLTLHARTKKDGYTHPARWDYIKEAKKQLDIPICGNGDITSAESAINMLQKTGCDHLMIGRQAAKDPLIFHRIQSALKNIPFEENFALLLRGVDVFFHEILKRHSPMGSIKQLASYILSQSPELKKEFLTQTYQTPHEAITSLRTAIDKLFIAQSLGQTA